MYIGIVWARGSGSTLKGKNKYPVLGKPLIYYPLRSVRESGAVEHLYVFTEDDEIAAVTESVGWKVIPRPQRFITYADKGFSMEAAWELITRHVAADLDIPLPEEYVGWLDACMQLTGRTFSLNCNNCLVRSETYAAMREKQHRARVANVVPAYRVEPNFMLGMPGDYLYPLLGKGHVNRQFLPPVFTCLGKTYFRDKQYQEFGKPHSCYVEISEIEGMDVHSREDIEFVEFFLEKHPEHLGFS
jgi:CMP-N-acetylneuraminic acid synthetase